MRIMISSNIAKVTAELEAAARKQIPYATAVALTHVAKDAQAKVRSDLPKTFTIRNSWVSKGIQIKAAKKRSWPIQAEVGTRDDFMARQSEGGIKTGLSGKSVGIPYAARANRLDITRQSKWPSRLAKRKGFFVVSPKAGKLAGKTAVFKRNGRNLQLFYVLQKSVRIRPDWQFKQQVESTAQRVYDKRFGEALAKALSTAK